MGRDNGIFTSWQQIHMFVLVGTSDLAGKAEAVSFFGATEASPFG